MWRGPPGRPGAASVCLRPLLAAEPRPARVIGVSAAALYLAVARAGDPVPIVAVVSADGIRLPNSVVVASRAASRPFEGVRQGQSAMVGAGGVRIGEWGVRVARWWAPRPTRRPVQSHLLRTGLVALTAERPFGLVPASVTDRLDRLAAALRAHDLPLALAWARALVGLGPGLTPAGDDALAGLVLALGSFAWPDTELVARFGRQITAYAVGRTTALSAALLGHAAAGQAADEVVDVLDALAGRRPARPAVERLLRVGHTSGSCLATGLAAGAAVVLAWSAESAGSPESVG